MCVCVCHCECIKSTLSKCSYYFVLSTIDTWNATIDDFFFIVSFFVPRWWCWSNSLNLVKCGDTKRNLYTMYMYMYMNILNDFQKKKQKKHNNNKNLLIFRVEHDQSSSVWVWDDVISTTYRNSCAIIICRTNKHTLWEKQK